MTSLTAVREDVHSRSERSKWVTVIFKVPCLTSLAATVLTIFFVGDRHHHIKPIYVVFHIGMLLLTLKEVLFTGSRSGSWPRPTPRQTSSQSPSGSRDPTACLTWVYVSSLSDPITFKLLLQCISWADVTVNALSVSVALLVALVKYLAGL